MPREKAQAAETARPKVPMRRPGADCLVVVMKRGNACGAKGAGHRRREGANWRQDELQFSAEGGSLRFGGTSRMTRECQVRICERLGAKFPGPTQRMGRLGISVGGDSAAAVKDQADRIARCSMTFEVSKGQAFGLFKQN